MLQIISKFFLKGALLLLATHALAGDERIRLSSQKIPPTQLSKLALKRFETKILDEVTLLGRAHKLGMKFEIQGPQARVLLFNEEKQRYILEGSP